MNRELFLLEQKNFWTDEDRAVYRAGGRRNYERARAQGNIKQLQRRLAKCTDKTEEADILRSLDEWQDCLSKMTPPINEQMAAE